MTSAHSPSVVVLGGPNGAGKSTAAPRITELFDEGTKIDEALREAARDARRFHKAIGNPMATWRDGKVVWVQPEDIVVDKDDGREPSE